MTHSECVLSRPLASFRQNARRGGARSRAQLPVNFGLRFSLKAAMPSL